MARLFSCLFLWTNVDIMVSKVPLWTNVDTYFLSLLLTFSYFYKNKKQRKALKNKGFSLFSASVRERIRTPDLLVRSQQAIPYFTRVSGSYVDKMWTS